MLPERIASCAQLRSLVLETGFLPLSPCAVPGFSVEEMTRDMAWWSGDPEKDPWRWRERIAAQGEIAYGKFFDKKAGFVSKEWFAHFANARRDGYDFDTAYELGMAPSGAKRIMDCLANDALVPFPTLKRACGQIGLTAGLSFLQTRAYVVIRGTMLRRKKTGEEYGWPCNLFSTAEALFGEESVRARYDTAPSRSREIILKHLSGEMPDAPVASLQKIL